MKRWFVALSLAVCSLALIAPTAEAKRLGGGGSSGMKRDLPARTAPDAVPAKPASPGNAAAPTPAAPGAAAAAAAAPKRSWLGPVAGLAAGLGLAALFSHLGLGGELANFVMLALLAVVAFVVIRLVMRRFAPAASRPMATANGMPTGMSFSGPEASSANASPSSVGSGSAWNAQPAAGALSGASALAPAATSGSGHALPEGFDAREFERLAKMIFIRLQAANDAADLNDLRNFTTPELFASLRLDLQERGPSTQQTDVVQIDAEVVDFAEEADRQVVSVRFHGLIRELAGGAANDFDEVWHLVKPLNGSQWAIAGIQQSAAA